MVGTVHPEPTSKTIKELYAHALYCAAPDCRSPLYRDGPDGQRVLNSRIAHICARREHGPRWDPSMTADENRATPNLLLLCLQHADDVDRPENLTSYPSEVLRGWKKDQLATFNAAAGSGLDLSDDEVAEVRRRSFEQTVVLQGQTLILGGLGGTAGGAGGGGAAIGHGAVGGKGGEASKIGEIRLEGTPGEQGTGAGGGGAGVMDAGALPPDAERASSGTEGEGFVGAVDGEAGGDSIVSIGDDIVVRAPGGTAGLAGTGLRSTTDGLSVSALFCANYSELQNGLVYASGAGWQNLSLLKVPTVWCFRVVVLFEAGGVDEGEYTVRIEARGPTGAVSATASFPLTVVKAGDVVRVPHGWTLCVEIDAYGIWTVAVATESKELAVTQLLVKRFGERGDEARP